jgi:lysophospholipase L1-like esterase
MSQPILFTGSSIIALWENLASAFPGETLINTAISGAQTADLLPQLDTLVIAHRPRLVCYYCGSNDINNQVPPAQIAANVARTRDLLSRQLPAAPFAYLSIIRAPQKADCLAQVDETNARIARIADQSPNFHFLDINPIFFTPQGAPRLEYYLEDGLHLTPPAYAALGASLAPRILELAGGARPTANLP